MRVPSKTTSLAIKREIEPGWWLDSRLALWLADERILVAADLHWGYAASHRARGNLLPLWGDDQISQRLDALVHDYQPREMVWLGDVVHAAEGASAAESFLSTLSIPVQVLAGNHDRRWRGRGDDQLQRGRYFFHHGDVSRKVPLDCTEVIGHYHPAVTWSDGAGGNLKLPALISSKERLVIPAFSPWAAGVDCTSLLTESSTAWAIAPHRIFALPSSKQRTATV